MKKFLAALAVTAILAFAAPSFAAENPFMDLPQGHWAYDAAAFLASRGVVSGYPDGAYKGTQPVTRYEMASTVARALAKVDAEKCSKQDLDVLKKLTAEFKDELDALGVKVDKIDKNTALLEKNIGGWKLSGQLYFDAKFWSADDRSFQSKSTNDDMRQFKFGRARLFLAKQIDKDTSMLTRINAHGADSSFTFDRWYVDTKLPWDIGFRFGRFNYDWEDDEGLYDKYMVNTDAAFGDYNVNGFQFTKSWGIWKATAIVGRNLGKTFNFADVSVQLGNSHMMYSFKLGAKTEKWKAGFMGYWLCGDNMRTGIGGTTGTVPYAHEFGFATYGIYAGYNFTPAVELKGVYYLQTLTVPDSKKIKGKETPQSWRAILDIKQEALKFAGFWLEYGEEDGNFIGNRGVGYEYGMGQFNANAKLLVGQDAKVGYLNLIADRKWTNKLSTYVRYAQMHVHSIPLGDTIEWSLGVRYQYTPAIQFKLEFARTNFGTSEGYKTQYPNKTVYEGAENLLRFRTTVNF